MNLLCPEDIEWNLVCSLLMFDYNHSKYRNEKFGIEMEKISNRTKCGTASAPDKTYFYITGQSKEYTNLQKLCDDWNEIRNYDDPDNEIVWEKKIVKRIKLNP